MRKLIFTTIFLLLLSSCSQHKEKEVKKFQGNRELNSLLDSNLFVGEYKAKAMVLGVFHFNSELDLSSFKSTFPFDILESKRQFELDLLLEQIEKYRPTKILLESNRIDNDSIVNDLYHQYLDGAFKISNKKSEIYQIGFKLAKNIGHQKVYCSDASADWFGVNLDWENYDDVSYLKSHNQYDKTNRHNYEKFYELQDSLTANRSLIQTIIMLNNPKNRLKDHQAYLTNNVLEGAGDNYIGADGVARWYRRNLRIFANAYDLTNFEKEDRLLLIYGSGHVWQLRQFFIDSPDYEYVEPNDYLNI